MRQAEMRYTPGSICVQICRSTAAKVVSVKELRRKKVVKRIMEVMRSLVGRWKVSFVVGYVRLG